ncbi:MAG TPA: glycoside hydrolase family 2 TIM barrel-domain containing protein [Limnochordia bacterium]|nr:glycoside hydrolase family 2 TIM barrel-domain containing protein [Limnochordia bacterium]
MRQIKSLSCGWLFREDFSNDYLTAQSPELFQVVNLPHMNKEIPYNYFDEKMYQFVSTYVKKIDILPEYRNQRVFVDFEGAMTYTEVFFNGNLVQTHKGGYTPFSADITEFLDFEGDNTIVVKLDSTERPDIPPFGNVIDYLTYGGIYRDVSLRVVNRTYIENVFAKPKVESQMASELATTIFVSNTEGKPIQGTAIVELYDQASLVAQSEQTFQIDAQTKSTVDVEMGKENLDGVKLWDIEDPNLYELRVSLAVEGQVLDYYQVSIGFREAVFKTDGFYLNGRKLQVRGLNRHQAFPYVGYAMPERAQKRDADILKDELHLNAARTSHYPQSVHFLDRCDEIGLLVFEEIPGWQHIGGPEWKDVSYNDVRLMIERDWNHPSIIMWGVRINESPDDHDFYLETNRIARELDPTRPTAGVRCHRHSEFLEDIFTVNDFSHSGGELILDTQESWTNLPHPVPYFVTEFNGHMYPTKRFDQEERLMEHTLRHVRVQDTAAKAEDIHGAFGWCAFDYNTHFEFGAGDRICYHGVMDMFRIPKFAAHVYRSQVSPTVDPVLEPVTLWARGERSIGGILPLVILTNCDYVDVFLAGEKVGQFYPDRDRYSGLEYPPVVIEAIENVGVWGSTWFDGEFVGYHEGKEIARKKFVKNPVVTELIVTPDDTELIANGQDVTRIVLKVVDQVGNLVPYLAESLKIEVTGPAQIIGPDQVTLIGGCLGTWIKTTNEPGNIRVSVAASRMDLKGQYVDLVSQREEG